MFNENLKKLIDSEKTNSRKVSLIVDIKYGTFNSWVTGEREPKFDTLTQFVHKYLDATGKRINVDWLITGEGEMFLFDENEEQALWQEQKKDFTEQGYWDEKGYWRKKD